VGEQTTKILVADLIAVLEEQIRVYRHLLEIVRKEKDILVAANLDDLNENNRAKEAMLVKIRALEAERLAKAHSLYQDLQLHGEHPRLLEMARHLDTDSADKLRNIHSVMELLLRRVQEYNQQNEALVQAALSNITGAMKEIKGTLSEKPTYQKKGEVEGVTPAGQLVSREA
jgi:flagellar biosynthesis/type III secretory pathway chaperone